MPLKASSERRILRSGVQPVWVSGPPRLTGPKRVRAGARVRLRLKDAPRGSRASLQRKIGGRWQTLATRTTGRRPTTFAIRLAKPGRAVFRVRIRSASGTATVSKPLRIRVRSVD
jgi:hypothetical protein